MTTRDHWHEDARAAMAVLLADYMDGSPEDWPEDEDMALLCEQAALAADCLMAEAKKRNFYPEVK